MPTFAFSPRQRVEAALSRDCHQLVVGGVVDGLIDSVAVPVKGLVLGWEVISEAAKFKYLRAASDGADFHATVTPRLSTRPLE
jgi:hypothetical protein